MSTPLHPICQPKVDIRVVGIYHTKTGKIGAEIKRHAYPNQRVVYSYDGKWCAGSGLDAEHIKRGIQIWKHSFKGLKVIQEFTEA